MEQHNSQPKINSTMYKINEYKQLRLKNNRYFAEYKQLHVLFEYLS
jgi:hypothetical protein